MNAPRKKARFKKQKRIESFILYRREREKEREREYLIDTVIKKLSCLSGLRDQLAEEKSKFDELF